MPSELKNKHKVGLLINLAAKELELLSATERKSTAKTHVKAFQMSLRCRNHTRAFATIVTCTNVFLLQVDMNLLCQNQWSTLF